jgi:hypothetical protein
VTLFVHANEPSEQTTFNPGASLEVERFQDSAAEKGQDKLGQGEFNISLRHQCWTYCLRVIILMLNATPLLSGKRLFEEAIQVLASSSITIDQRVFVPQQSSLVRTLLSDELQKQKGILPTALRLVTQGFMSFFSSAPAAPVKSTEGSRDSTATKTAPKRHRDPIVDRAMEMLLRAGYDYGNDDALWALANIHFVGGSLIYNKRFTAGRNGTLTPSFSFNVRPVAWPIQGKTRLASGVRHVCSIGR